MSAAGVSKVNMSAAGVSKVNMSAAGVSKVNMSAICFCHYSTQGGRQRTCYRSHLWGWSLQRC